MASETIQGYLRLTRPPNLPTAAADILAGAAIGAFLSAQSATSALLQSWDSLGLLMAASVLLYAGGVVLNDVFDARLDAVERPERPIPSGLIPKKRAAFFGGLLLATGVALAFIPGSFSGKIALVLAGSILFYDAVAKKIPGLGPLAMGVCRSLNLWLGISLLSPGILPWHYLWVPLLYIFAITTVSRSEVQGGGRPQLILAVFLYAIAIFGVGILVVEQTGRWAVFLPFAIIFASMVFLPLLRALKDPVPGKIRKAVKAGVLGLVALDAAWAAGYAHWGLGLCVLALLPLSALLARSYAVT